MSDDRCRGCYYNRSMVVWGDKVQACFYSLEKKRELYGTIDGNCSGFEENEKQLEIAFGNEKV